jgi:hypothetical protein
MSDARKVHGTVAEAIYSRDIALHGTQLAHLRRRIAVSGDFLLSAQISLDIHS